MSTNKGLALGGEAAAILGSMDGGLPEMTSGVLGASPNAFLPLVLTSEIHVRSYIIVHFKIAH